VDTPPAPAATDHTIAAPKWTRSLSRPAALPRHHRASPTGRERGMVHDPVRGPFAAPHPAGCAFARRIAATRTPRHYTPGMLASAHRVLYAQVPNFDCEPGCTDCCGAIPMSAWEWDQIADKRFAASDCTTCPYSAEGDCAIHPNRPLVCRLFGAVDHPLMTCPRGRGPDRKLSAEEARRLMRAYEQLTVDS